jgi:hypothetical protein
MEPDEKVPTWGKLPSYVRLELGSQGIARNSKMWKALPPSKQSELYKAFKKEPAYYKNREVIQGPNPRTFGVTKREVR